MHFSWLVYRRDIELDSHLSRQAPLYVYILMPVWQAGYEKTVGYTHTHTHTHAQTLTE